MKKSNPLSRRSFLADSAIAISAPAVLGLAGRLTAQDSAAVRFAMIGIGGRGSELLSQALKAPGARCTALCDISDEALARASQAASEHKPATFSDYRKMLEKQEIDAVFVATPPYLHKEMILNVLASGRSCYTEKPVALTVEEIGAVAEAAKGAKGCLQVGQQLRYQTQLRQLMPRIHQGEFGKIGFIRGQRYADWEGPGSRGPMKWLWSIAQSGDQIVEQSVHELDLINWIMNGHPLRAAGLGGQNLIHEPPGADVFDTYGLAFDYPGGRQAVFSMVKYAPYTHNLGGRIINAYCEKASVDVQLSDPCTIVWRGEKAPEPEQVHVPDVDFTFEAIKDFFHCVREGDRPFCDVETGRTAALTALLGRKAMYERRVVTWEELLAEGAPVKPVWS